MGLVSTIAAYDAILKRRRKASKGPVTYTWLLGRNGAIGANSHARMLAEKG